MPTFGSLFAGIGGLDLGLERAGWTCRWQVEIDDFCQRVLAKHWPDVVRHGDIRQCHAASSCDMAHSASARLEGAERQELEGRGVRPAHGGCLESVDLICGGFPCQPVSVAGKRLAQADERWLWPEFARVIRALRPRLVFVENVPGLLIRGAGDVLGDLAACGYDAEWDCIPASAVGAPHRRDRVWIVAYANGDERRTSRVGCDTGADGRHDAGGCGAGFARDVADAAGSRRDGPEAAWPPLGISSGRGGDVENTLSDGSRSRWPERSRLFGGAAPECSSWWSVEPDVGRVAHGVPARVDRLRSLGNAVIPQVAEWIGRRLMEAYAVTVRVEER